MRDIRKAIDELRSTLCAQLCAVHLAPYSVHMVSDIDGGLALTGKSFDRESIVRTVLTRVRLYKAVLRADSPDYRLFAGLEQSLAHILTKEAE
ncbi:MAG: hypothetical protein HQ559_01785 [Lentisphaerae bacterium]|nr:hypothetical protein [Lentisphaerota bacterium]